MFYQFYIFFFALSESKRNKNEIKNLIFFSVFNFPAVILFKILLNCGNSGNIFIIIYFQSYKLFFLHVWWGCALLFICGSAEWTRFVLLHSHMFSSYLLPPASLFCLFSFCFYVLRSCVVADELSARRREAESLNQQPPYVCRFLPHYSPSIDLFLHLHHLIAPPASCCSSEKSNKLQHYVVHKLR